MPEDLNCQASGKRYNTISTFIWIGAIVYCCCCCWGCKACKDGTCCKCSAKPAKSDETAQAYIEEKENDEIKIEKVKTQSMAVQPSSNPSFDIQQANTFKMNNNQVDYNYDQVKLQDIYAQ